MKELVITKEDTKKLSLLFSHLSDLRLRALLFLLYNNGTSFQSTLVKKIGTEKVLETLDLMEKWDLIERKSRTIYLTSLGKAVVEASINILEVMKNGA